MTTHQDHIKSIFARAGAVLEGHFVYSSRRHGGFYVNKDRAYVNPFHIAELAKAIARLSETLEFEVVAAPAIGGALLAQAIGRAFLDQGRDDISVVYAEKETLTIPDPEGLGRKAFVETGPFVFKRGHAADIRGSKVLVVEDILTTGGSARRTVDAVRAAGGEVVTVRALWNRGGVTVADLNVDDLQSLVDERIDDYPAGECPLCATGMEINVNIGHGAAFVAEHGQPIKK